MPEPRGVVSQSLACVGVLACVSIGLFAVDRAHMWWQRCCELWAERRDSQWMLKQCKQTDFYQSMLRHSSLCDELIAKEREFVLITALSHVVSRTSLCGEQNCSDLLASVLTWSSQDGFALLALLVVIVICMPIIMLPYYRMRELRRFEIPQAPFRNTLYCVPGWHEHDGRHSAAVRAPRRRLWLMNDKA